MKKRPFIPQLISFFTMFLLFSLLIACSKTQTHKDNIVGAWKGKVQFKTGAFAEIKNWEFMWVFNSGGTMTESSNYDGVPPTPPAYGIWKKTGDKQYEARYEFFVTQNESYVTKTQVQVDKTTDLDRMLGVENKEYLDKFDLNLDYTGGFPPAGYGVLYEKIILSADGKSYSSSIKLDLFDQTGKRTVFNDEATAEAKRMEFDSK